MLTALGDERGFVHKRIFRGLKGAVGGILGGPGGIIGGAARGFFDPGIPPIPSRAPVLTRAQAMTRFGAGATAAELASVGLAPVACPAGFVLILGRCVPTSVQSIVSDVGATFRPPQLGRVNGPLVGPPRPDQFGEAVMGQYGAALQPEVRESTTRRCPRGSVLGTDGLCYNRRDIRNSERFWPRGRRPLLTGGEMRCISIASSAAKKFQKKQKQLQELGFLKAPPARRRAAPAVHVRTAGVTHN